MQNPASEIGARIRKRRNAMDWSLDVCSERTGVSKAMLGQIERGESSPTVGVLWKIATGLEMSLSVLLGSDAEMPGKAYYQPDTRSRISDSDGIEAYTLIPFSPSLGFELMVVSLAPDCVHVSTPQAAGVVEHVVPLTAGVGVRLGGRWTDVAVNDAFRFPADQPHAYRNRASATATFHNLIFYT